MEKTAPIKRKDFLKPLSREHHHGLLLSWKIRTGLKKNADPARIMKYVKWFYTFYLKSHFDIEEKYIYPILGKENLYITKALQEHDEIKELIHTKEVSVNNLLKLADTIEYHVRYEERTLFNLIQDKATNEQLQQITTHLVEAPFIEHEDQFWA